MEDISISVDPFGYAFLSLTGWTAVVCLIVAHIVSDRTQQRGQPLQWRHNGRAGVSNNQPRDSLLNRIFQAQIKENIKTPCHFPLCGEFTGDRWISRTKGQ